MLQARPRPAPGFKSVRTAAESEMSNFLIAALIRNGRLGAAAPVLILSRPGHLLQYYFVL